MSTIFHITRAFIFLILASFASTALSITVNSESGGASIDGTWAFPGCFLDPGEFDDMDYEEYLIFDDNTNTVESRIVQYASSNNTCSDGVTNIVSEIFDITDVERDVQSLGWLGEDIDGDDVPVPPPPCQDPDACQDNLIPGSLDSSPLVTDIEIFIPGDPDAEDEEDRVDKFESGLHYIDDTGPFWFLYRDAGEDDAPSLFMSGDEPLRKVSPAAVSVSIDIKPGSDPNSVNPRSKGVIPVAVLGSTDFDAMQVDFSTVTFGPDGASTAHDGHVEDVNDDGFMDAVFHFKTQETGIVCGDTEATLNGEIFDGTPITGTDTINTVGCKGKSNEESTSSEKVNATTSGSSGAVSWMLLLGLGVLGLWRLNRRTIHSN